MTTRAQREGTSRSPWAPKKPTGHIDWQEYVPARPPEAGGPYIVFTTTGEVHWQAIYSPAICGWMLMDSALKEPNVAYYARIEFPKHFPSRGEVAGDTPHEAYLRGRRSVENQVIQSFPPHPMCRGCADMDGRCEDGQPCNPFERALEIIRHSRVVEDVIRELRNIEDDLDCENDKLLIRALERMDIFIAQDRDNNPQEL